MHAAWCLTPQHELCKVSGKIDEWVSEAHLLKDGLIARAVVAAKPRTSWHDRLTSPYAIGDRSEAMRE